MFVIADQHVDENGTKGMVVFLPYDVVYRLGLAVEQGQPEAVQRQQHGDVTVDVVNELHRNPAFLADRRLRHLPDRRSRI